MTSEPNNQTRLIQLLTTLDWEPADVADDEVLTDALLIGRLTRLADGRTSVLYVTNHTIDTITRLGLIEAARGIAGSGDWTDADDDTT